jgi:aminopeptidase N/puromycin-sensitive aminopeptidase
MFVQQHWPEIERKMTAGSAARIVEATGAFCSVEKRAQVSMFFHAHPVAASQRTLSRALGSIDECVSLRTAQEPELRRWLDAQTPIQIPASPASFP